MMSRERMRESLKVRTLRHFTLSTVQSAGRNFAGRITAFHRGGGSKRLQRKLDLKRRTSSIGIVERIEDDPNRSSRIALVRWIGGVVQLVRQRNVHPPEEFAPQPQILESTRATILCLFSFSSLPGQVDQRKLACSQSKCSQRLNVLVGLPSFIMPPSSKSQACAGRRASGSLDPFLSALSSPPLSKGEQNQKTSLAFPRIGLAGAKPAFFAPRLREKKMGKRTLSLCEIRKWRRHCALWSHRMKGKGGLSWQSDRQQASFRLVGAAERKESQHRAELSFLPAKPIGQGPKDGGCKVDRAPLTYILASHQCSAGQMVMNFSCSKAPESSFLRPAQNAHTHLRFQDHLVRTANQSRRLEGGSQLSASLPRPPASRNEILDLHSQVGNCLPLADIRMGTLVHDIESHPGQGAKLARAAGTSAKIIKEAASSCLVRLPSGLEKVIDSRCRATIGIVSNPNHGKSQLRKAGQSRWLGRRPIVRGVAMNPVDHPHGGGEGRTKGGRPSVSPWGKPTKAGFRAVVGKGRK